MNNNSQQYIVYSINTNPKVGDVVRLASEKHRWMTVISTNGFGLCVCAYFDTHTLTYSTVNFNSSCLVKKREKEIND